MKTVEVALNEMKPFTHAFWPPGTLGGCDPSAAVNGFFHLRDPQSGLANGPEWAALKKHRHSIHPETVRTNLIEVSFKAHGNSGGKLDHVYK